MNYQSEDLKEEKTNRLKSLKEEEITNYIKSYQMNKTSSINQKIPLSHKNYHLSKTPHNIGSPIKCGVPLSSKSKNTINKQNLLLNGPKAPNSSSIYSNNNIYQNFDIQQQTYSIMKDYSRLKINKEENFMERMKFDIYKRKIKDEKVNQLVQQNKMKINERKRVKAFMRLIEDSNRRIGEKKNLDTVKTKLKEGVKGPHIKKYKESEWNEIYRERFKRYQEEVDKKNEDKIKEKQEKERLKEEQEIELCKVKKAPKDVIEKSSKRLYEESFKRRVKMKQLEIQINDSISPFKYNKKIEAEAENIMSEENVNENNNNNRRVNEYKCDSNFKINSNFYCKNKQCIKGKKKGASEYSNILVDMKNKKNLPFQCLVYNNDIKQKGQFKEKEGKNNNKEIYSEDNEEEKEISNFSSKE